MTNKWQPIETAPKGKLILVYGYTCGLYNVAAVTQDIDNDEWLFRGLTEYDNPEFEPLGWQELPPPPPKQENQDE